MSDKKFNLNLKQIVLFVMIGFAIPVAYNVYNKPSTDKELIDAYHKLHYNSKDFTWGESKWFGIHALQNPNDVWIIQEIIYDTKPDLIIETGTYHGGSAILWALIQKYVVSDGKVVTIDINMPKKEAIDHPLFKERVTFLHGSSTDPKIVDQVKQMSEGKKVLVILDSWHKKEHVLDELRAYHDLVQVGGYILVQDTNVNGHPVTPFYGPGPMEAMEDFMKENNNFVIDKSRERLLLTYHPNGYLKRVK